MAGTDMKAVVLLVMPMFVCGFILVGIGLVEGFQPVQDVVSDGDTVDVAYGEQRYRANCAACHGVNLRGIAGLGKSLLDSSFVEANTDAELHAFIVEGRSALHPANTTGVAMPPRGGNPTLSDADIAAIIAYIRSES
jgi:disulfide bond formation protein DsbB